MGHFIGFWLAREVVNLIVIAAIVAAGLLLFGALKFADWMGW
jgi:hypothetical protein